jgi:pimeloyl-ACP methyl ester carboxylesterase
MGRLNKKKVELLGSRISYWERNPDIDDVLIIIHGFGGNHLALTPMSKHLSSFRVIMIDLPGFGESTSMRVHHSFVNYEKLLEQFCNKLGIATFNLWGHSYGATICIGFARITKLKIKNLILVSPAFPDASRYSKAGVIYYRIASMSPEYFQRRMLANARISRMTGQRLLMEVSENRREQLLQNGERDLKFFNSKVVNEVFLDFYKLKNNKELEFINLRTLIIGGDKDILVPIEYLKHLKLRFSNSRLIEIQGQGHLSPLERPGHLAKLTSEFILDTSENSSK